MKYLSLSFGPQVLHLGQQPIEVSPTPSQESDALSIPHDAKQGLATSINIRNPTLTTMFANVVSFGTMTSEQQFQDADNSSETC